MCFADLCTAEQRINPALTPSTHFQTMHQIETTTLARKRRNRYAVALTALAGVMYVGYLSSPLSPELTLEALGLTLAGFVCLSTLLVSTFSIVFLE